MQDISATKGFVTAYRICSSRLIRKLPQYRLNPFLQAAPNSARLYAQQGRNLVGSLNLEARILLTLGIGTQKMAEMQEYSGNVTENGEMHRVLCCDCSWKALERNSLKKQNTTIAQH